MKTKTCILAALAVAAAWFFPVPTAQAKALSPQTQDRTLQISGKVLDQTTQEAIIGANVLVDGTRLGAATDLEGNFSIQNVPAQGTLVVSYMGYITQMLPVEGKTTFTIYLQEDTELLSEVVVVGYGVQKKVNLTGSVSSVEGSQLEQRPVADISQSLQGLVPGLFISNSGSGRPGSSGTLTLRGQGNLSNNANPYVLVDGVEMDLGDVNPNDVQNISVLKDAAACAIYGARAAYGVVLVTTKRGQDGKMRVSYQGTAGWSAPTVLPEMVDSYQFATFWNDGCVNTGSPRSYSAEKMDLLKKFVADPTSVDPWFELAANASMNPAFENSESGVGNTDYFDLHYKDWAFKQHHNLSVSGGTAKAQYYVSGGYYTEDGILRYADIGYDRFQFSTNLSSQVTPWLKLKVNSKFMHSVADTPFGDGGLSEGFYHSLARFRPTVHHTDPNGRFTELTMIPYLQSGTRTSNDRDRMSLTGGFDLQPAKNWFIFFDYTLKMMDAEYEALNVAPLIYGRDGVSTSKGVRDELGISPDGRYTRSVSKSRYQTLNLYTNYLFSLADAHNFTLMAGYQEENSHYSYLKNAVTGLYSTANPNVGMGSGDKTVTDTRNGWATRGFFGRINYDYKGRYLVEVNGRYDGSSRFAKDSRWGFFPSASLGWNIHREAFMQPAAQVLSNLKLRASYGLLGNQAGADLYTFASTMSLNGGLGNYIFADGRHIYTNAAAVVNPFTTWEKVRSVNLGVDFGFLKNALTGSFEVFQRETRDMLGPAVDFPDFFGATAPKTNNAEMRNRGWELVLSYKGGIGKDIAYTVNGSLSDATAEVTRYEGTLSNPGSNWYEGKMAGEIWGYQTDGLLATQAEADSYNSSYNLSYISSTPWTPGDLKYRDLNGDGKINNGSNTLGDMGDVSVIGNTTPRYQFTLSGSISWKGLSLSLLFQGVGKRDWSPGSAAYFWGCGPYAQVTVFDEHMDYWTPDNPGAYYPKPYIHTAGGVGPYRNKNIQTSDRYLQNAAYCRLKNLSLSYNLPGAWVRKMGLQKVQVYFSGENLLTFTSLKGMFDPEAIYTSNTYTGEGGKNYPMNKVISLGLSVNL